VFWPVFWLVFWLVTVALGVEGVVTRGLIVEASGVVVAPELVTAVHPPVLFWQVPVPCEPLGSAETVGLVPDAELVTVPVQEPRVGQLSAAPEAEAAEGPEPPAGSLLPRVWAAPGPVEAIEIVCGAQVPPPAVQLAVPVEVWGLPVFGSGLDAELVAVPLQPVAVSALAGQVTEPEATDTADGPVAAVF
jgi:hypothetical protein